MYLEVEITNISLINNHNENTMYYGWEIKVIA